MDGHRQRLLSLTFCIIVAATAPPACAQPADTDPLRLEATIPLGPVRGRIDHMAVDLERRRLFVAELGNDTVAVVDLDARKVVRRLTGLREPQGVAYVRPADTLYVANAGDGSVRAYRGPDYAASGRIDLGEDADNIRIDPRSGRLLVGYGGGAIAVIDAATNKKIDAFALPAHPESFQLDSASGRLFANLPDARAIAVLDGATGAERARWRMRHGGNFPMALDAQRVLVAFRNPPMLAAFDAASGAAAGETAICGDADDLFVDARRRRVYVACGEGFIDVLNAEEPNFPRLARIATASGARTALFVPELDRLFVAARARAGEPAAIRVYRAAPPAPERAR